MSKFVKTRKTKNRRQTLQVLTNPQHVHNIFVSIWNTNLKTHRSDGLLPSLCVKDAILGTQWK
jgi:hypothetical protein